MLGNELSCLLILICASPLLYWSLWTRPKPAACAMLSIPCGKQFLPQECSLLWNENWFVHYVAVRHRNMTSVSDVVLVSLCIIYCGSNSLRVDDSNSIFSFPSQTNYLHRSPPAWIVRVGWCGDFARPRWGPSHHQVSCSIVYDLFIFGSIVRNEVNASLFSRSVQFCFFQAINLWLYAVSLVTSLTILEAKCCLFLLWPVYDFPRKTFVPNWCTRPKSFYCGFRVEIYLCTERNGRPIKLWIEATFARCLAICC